MAEGMMMTGFDRLMRDEHPTRAESLPDKLMRYWDDGREEGRREVLREIAEMPEPLELGAVPAVFVPGWRHVDRCEWCHAETLANTRITHQTTCLWLRAAQAVKDAE